MILRTNHRSTKPSQSASAVLLFLVAAICAPGTANAGPQQALPLNLRLQRPAHMPTPYFGRAMSWVGDWNGDGLTDVAVSECMAEALPAFPGEVEVRCGATGQVLLALLGPEGHRRFGAILAATPDIDGDGEPDLLIYSEFSEGRIGMHLVGSASKALLASATVLYPIVGDHPLFPPVMMARLDAEHGATRAWTGLRVYWSVQSFHTPEGGVVLAAATPFVSDEQPVPLLWHRETVHKGNAAVLLRFGDPAVEAIAIGGRIGSGEEKISEVQILHAATGEVLCVLPRPREALWFGSALAVVQGAGESEADTLVVASQSANCGHEHADGTRKYRSLEDHGMVFLFDARTGGCIRQVCVVDAWADRWISSRQPLESLQKDAFHPNSFGSSLAASRYTAPSGESRALLAVGDLGFKGGTVFALDADSLRMFFHTVGDPPGDRPQTGSSNYGHGWMVLGDDPGIGLFTRGRILARVWSPLGHHSSSGVMVHDFTQPSAPLVMMRPARTAPPGSPPTLPR